MEWQFVKAEYKFEEILWSKGGNFTEEKNSFLMHIIEFNINKYLK